MKTYLVGKYCFEQFYIDNFEELLKNSNFIIQYNFNISIIIKQYHGYYSEGISIFSENNDILHNVHILHHELNLENLIRVNTLIDNQKNII